MTNTTTLQAAPESAEPGLRERKRRATSRAIQFAVLELSVDKGLENVTVDDISRRADISPRTFFNYFDSKEAAVLGESQFSDELPPAVSEAFLAAGPDASILDGLLDIMLVVAVPDTVDFELHQLRKQVVHQAPHLLIQRISKMREFELALVALVEQRLTTDARIVPGAHKTADHTDLHERASLTAQVAIAAMRHAWGCWADSSDAPAMSVLLANSFRDLRTVI